jgi:ATP-dependent exoDNAse (exonuclease V) beta subunit
LSSEQLTFDVGAAEPPAPAPAPPLAAPHPPTPEQEAAIGNRDRDVFLEAGAGTGKTRVLVSRYCDAVDLDGVDPERILAFTFTERAAAEMRRRVRVELTRRASLSDDPERRARLTTASRAGEGAPIGTIHGFCRRLLAAHPIAAGLDPRFRVLDAEESSRLAGRAFDEALAIAAEDPAVVTAAAGYRWRLQGMIRAAHADLRNRGERLPELPPIQINALERTADGELASPAEIERASAAYGALRRLVREFSLRYEALCAERAGVDFDHLQLLALELLSEHRAIAEAQRERFDHLLVDEFQDTSPIQVQLVEALKGPTTRLFAVGDEFQSIYAFRGADLASFRRERARIRERAQQEPSSGVVLPLAGSFRSDPDVVAAVNAVGAALLDDFRELRVGRLPAGPPPGPADEPAIELLLTNRDGWNDPEHRIPTARNDAPPSRVAEARFLAQRLRELADAGVEPGGMVVLLRAFTNVDVYAEALELQGLEPHVIGGRGYWSAQQVADALRLLACVANPLEDEALLGALASPACGASPDALWMLRRIAGRRRHLWGALEELFEPDAPRDEEPDERELARREEAARWIPRLPADDRERLERFHARLTGLRAKAPELPLDTLVERTLQTFDYDLTTLLMDEGRRRTANLLKLVRIATEYEAHDGRDLRGFLEHAANRAAASDREGEAAATGEDVAGVRVMTVHAAKGLEFETVAVADLGRSLCTGGQPPELRIAFESEEIAAAADEGPPPARVGLRLARAAAGSIDTDGYADLTEQAADAEAEESGRLAYVAASRAERRLILSGVYTDKDLEESEKPRRSRSALGCLLPALGVEGRDGQVVTVPAPAPRDGLDATFAEAPVAVRVIGAGKESAARLSAARPAPAPAAAAGAAGRPPLLALAERGTAAGRSLSYAALADYRRCGYRYLAEKVIGLGAGAPASAPAGNGPDGSDASRPPDAREERKGFGRAVHGLLEWSARNGWRSPPEELVAATLSGEGLEGEEHLGRATEMTGGWLASPLLAELREQGAEFRPELPFRIGLGPETVLRGTIDLLAVSPVAVTIVDYKTDRLGGEAPAELGEGYVLQRALYAAAVAEATGAAEVRSAYVFLELPDRPLVATIEAEEIAVGRERIEELVGDVRAGRFDATDRPHRALCHDCPARDRLCPHDRETTGRPSPEPPVPPPVESRA